MRWMIVAAAAALTPAIAQAPAGSPPTDTQALLANAPHCGEDEIVAPKLATILSGYGSGGFPIRTSSREAQAFFDNGMQLAHAFAHKAAILAFQRSAELDPNCAMCLWGQAWADGPTINYPIKADDQAKLAALVKRAWALGATSSQKQRELIAVLTLRYPQDGRNGDEAFARGMTGLANKYPDDDEILVLAADAVMIPAAHAGTISNLPIAVTMLETVLKRNPRYTPAIHFYIHATEMAGFAERAEPYADTLIALAPAASHLVHMPSHTWYHVGRYQDAADANVRAVAIGQANARRLGLPDPDGVWSLPYHRHNIQYGVGSALISGDAKNALLLSDPLVKRIASPKELKDMAGDPHLQMIFGTAYFAEGRFADPNAVLALPEPTPVYARAYWHYARGEAAARMGNAAAVRAEAAAIPDRAGAEREEDSSAAAARMMRIAHAVLDGRAAMLDHRPADAVIAFRKAARLQEARTFIGYADPPAFWYPVRRDVAAALIAAGKPKQAVVEAEAALKLTPKDPVSLAIRAEAQAQLGQAQQTAADHGSGWRVARRMS